MSKIETKIKQLQTAIDLISETNIMFSIKITELKQGHGKNIRHGRFLMNNLEHTILKKNNGYYFFFLFSNLKFISGKIIRADNLKYKNQIAWTNLIDLNNGDNK